MMIAEFNAISEESFTFFSSASRDRVGKLMPEAQGQRPAVAYVESIQNG